MQVLDKIVAGLSNEQLAGALGVDVETIKQHVKGLLKKTGLADRTQLAVWALHDNVTP